MTSVTKPANAAMVLPKTDGKNAFQNNSQNDTTPANEKWADEIQIGHWWPAFKPQWRNSRPNV